MDKSVQTNNRASKKQQELYDFVAEFISQNGYGPSYREIMAVLDYKSVSTVAVHVDGLVRKGYLKKLEGSARSLAIADQTNDQEELAHQKWLIEKVSKYTEAVNERSSQKEIRDAEVLLEAMQILGLNFDSNGGNLGEEGEDE